VIETSPPPVDVVLPCLDEAEALPWFLERIQPAWRGIVVVNGSTDGSADIARALGAYAVHEPWPGFGAACHAGLSVRGLPLLRDVDTATDVASVAGLRAGSRFVAGPASPAEVTR
jgi:glycosyltransferase involved in cell wall biosynthesis